MGTKGHKGTNTNKQDRQPYFDKTSATVGTLVNMTWVCRYKRSHYIVYDNGTELKLHFESQCDIYEIKHKTTSVKKTQANAIPEQVHQTIMGMLPTTEINMEFISESDILYILTNATCAICSTYHTVLKVSTVAAIF